MHALMVDLEGGSRRLSIHCVNDEGARVHTAPSVTGALMWLWLQGEREVLYETDEGPGVFGLELRTTQGTDLPPLTMRRAYRAGCSTVPQFPGMGDNPPVIEKPREGHGWTRQERRRWARATLHHATVHPVKGRPG